MWSGLAGRVAGSFAHSVVFCRAMHVCIVGSGPAGFYTADKLLKSFEQANVDILERLPVPFGLVRSGVAPDHPETKIVTNQFSRIAASQRCCLFGNVSVGRDVSLAELRDIYDVVVLAYGAESDNILGIDGEGLAGVHSAREFVWWYNGHPDCVNLSVDLQSNETAVILGQGNVAIDVARILLRPVEDLFTTDIADHALTALQNSNIRKVFLVGRRGPAQIACTTKELRELLGIKGIRVNIQKSDLTISSMDEEELSASRVHKRVYDLLCKAAQSQPSLSSTAQQEKELHFKFYRQPNKFLVSEDGKRVAGIQLEETILKGDKGRAQQHAIGTGIYEDLPSGLIFKSIGYKSKPMDGVAFDHRKGVVPNIQGRVLSAAQEPDSTVEPGLYVVGWLKRGPTGIIGTNLICAEEVANCVAEDAKKGLLPIISSHTGSAGLKELLRQRGICFVSFADWQKIDAFEVSQGSKKGKSREKLTRLTETLKAAGLN